MKEIWNAKEIKYLNEFYKKNAERQKETVGREDDYMGPTSLGPTSLWPTSLGPARKEKSHDGWGDGMKKEAKHG